MTLLGAQIETLRRLQSYEISGTVAAVKGLAIQVDNLPVPVGSLVRLGVRGGGSTGGSLRSTPGTPVDSRDHRRRGEV